MAFSDGCVPLHFGKVVLLLFSCAFSGQRGVEGFQSPNFAGGRSAAATTRARSDNHRFNQHNQSLHLGRQPFSLAQPTGRRKNQQQTSLVQQPQPSADGTTQAGATAAPSLFYVTEVASLKNDATTNNYEVGWDQVLQPGDCDEPGALRSCIKPLQEVEQTNQNAMSITDLTLLGTSAIAVAATSATLMRWIVQSGSWRYYLAGGICAAVSHSIPVPVDVVKTRKQVDPALADASLAQATRQIWQNEGWAALFAGAGPTFWGYFLEGAIKFGVYEVLKPAVKALIPIQTLAFCISAAISGFAASIMLCPMEALRIRLVADAAEFQGKNWIESGMTLAKREGFVGAFGKGILPMIYKQVPYTMTKNVCFDTFTRLAYASLGCCLLGGKTSASIKLVIPLCAAAAASVLSCISSQPGDMLLSLVNAQGGTRRTHDIARDILSSERGIRGFFVGIKTRFLHVGIIVTLQLLIYDFVKRACGIAATGTV